MPAARVSLSLAEVPQSGPRSRIPIADPGCFSTLDLPDGRKLAWHGFGDPEGRPLYFFHGFPSSRLLAALVHEQAAAAGIQIIAPDRPGFGRSTPQNDRKIESWADDVRLLANHLGHQRFGVLGVSCGGPYALACARLIPQRLHYVGLMAGMGPMNLPSLRREQLFPLRLLFGLASTHTALATVLLLPDALLFRHAPDLAIATLSGLLTAPDRALLRDNASLRARFCASFIEAYRQGTATAQQEAQLIGRLDGSLLHGISIPVQIYQGGMDRHVPAAMGRHIAAVLPAGRLHFYPNEGHLSILINRFSDCATHLLE